MLRRLKIIMRSLMLITVLEGWLMGDDESDDDGDDEDDRQGRLGQAEEPTYNEQLLHSCSPG